MLSYSGIDSGVSDLMQQIPGLNILNMGLCSANSSILAREDDEEKTV